MAAGARRRLMSDDVEIRLPSSAEVRASISENDVPWHNISFRVNDMWVAGGDDGERWEGPCFTDTLIERLFEALEEIKLGNPATVYIYELTLVFVPDGSEVGVGGETESNEERIDVESLKCTLEKTSTKALEEGLVSDVKCWIDMIKTQVPAATDMDWFKRVERSLHAYVRANGIES